MDCVNARVEGQLVSVVVPVYNSEAFLNRCADSILGQTHKNLQVLLVDDGSTDASGAICDEYAAKDNRVEVIHKTNGGLSDARNAGIDTARGEYIAFVDSDDYVTEDYVLIMLEAAVANNVPIVMCNFECVSNDGKPITWQPGYSHPVFSGEISVDAAFDAFSEPEGGVFVVAWNKLYKREFFKKIRYPLGRLHEDQFVIHHLLGECESIYCVPGRLYYYVQHEKSIMAAAYSVRNMDVIDAFLDRAEFCLQRRQYGKLRLAYKRALSELVRARLCLDLSKKENRDGWREYRKKIRGHGQTVLRYTGINISVRFIAAVYVPRLYSFGMKLLWKGEMR